MDELFSLLCRIIADPHTTITEHDEIRAVQVMLAFEDFLIDNMNDNLFHDLSEFTTKKSEELENKRQSP